MLKKILSSALALCMVFGTAAALPEGGVSVGSLISANAKTYNEYEYQVLADGTVEITKYNGNQSQVQIPSKIDGKKVTSLGENAFIHDFYSMDAVDLTKVIIPEGVKKIGRYCFWSQWYLSDISIPSTVEQIDAFAFSSTAWMFNKTSASSDPVIVNNILIEAMNCSGTLDIPYGVKAIAACALSSEDSAITKVNIPSTVTYIHDEGLVGTSSLRAITVDRNNPSYESVDGALYTKGAKKLIACPAAVTELTVPDTVTSIGSRAFTDCPGITLHCKSGSAAVQYAKSNGISYDLYDLRDVSALDIKLSQTSYTYDGKAKTPTLTIKNGSMTLKSGTDYTAVYKNNTNEGTASVTVTGKGKYSGTATKSFKISRISLSKAAVTGIKNKSYTGKAIKQSPVVKLNGKTLKSGTDYTVTYKNNKAVGTATVTITGKGSYKGSIKKTFKISKASVAKAKVTGISKRYKYTGKAIKPAVKKVTVGGVTLKKGRDYTVTYKNNKKTGTATVIITGKGNYKGTIKKTFKILSAQDYKMWQYTKQVVDLVNKERTSRGLKALKLNETLYSKAMIRSKEIVQLFSHARPNGTMCFTVLDDIAYYTCGENIAGGQRTPKEVVSAWMNSTGHRENILNPSYTDIGVGLVYKANSTYGYYWTQIFMG